MKINWLVLTEGPGGTPIPTYGNYGGPNWSGGEFVGDDEPGNYTVQPEDPLDALFLTHDQAYDQPDTLLRAQADLRLIEGILQQSPDEVTGEGDAYGGAAVLVMLYQIAVTNRHPELLTQVNTEAIVRGAIARIDEGSIQPDPEEVAALTTWLEQTSAVLADRDEPVLNAVAGELQKLADRIAGIENPTLPIDLSGDAFNFAATEAKAFVADVVEFVAEAWDPESLIDFVAAHQDVIHEHVSDALPKKFAFHIDLGDFAF